MIKILYVGASKRRFEVRLDFIPSVTLATVTGVLIGNIIANLIW